VIALLRVKPAGVLNLPRGWIAFAAGDSGIAACTLPRRTGAGALAEVDESLAAPTRYDALLPRAALQLRRYFAGQRASFDFPLDLSRVPDFTRRVLTAVSRIPYGETRSYGEVARLAGNPKAARGVGQAMARNPLAPIVPCHRVIGGDDSLVGFGGGLALKRRLLLMEGARVVQAEP
jgi:methylated-DNA-[protein]-cysteine S-methyltransferase